MSLPETPLTRRESYFSVMAGQNDTSILPEHPVTREEGYLDYIARNGGGGGGGDVTGVKGNAEVEYRTGNVNITAANVGAYTTTQTNTLLNGKTDIVERATENNFAAFDDSGNIKDSGKKAADFATPSNVAAEEIAGAATSTSITLTDSADGYVQGVTVKGRSEVVDGAIKSVGDAGWGVVDLGTLTWTKDGSRFRSDTITSQIKSVSAWNDPSSVNSKYETGVVSAIGSDNKKLGIYQAVIYIRDLDYNDETDFKSAMNGVLLYYPLADTTGATPTLGITSKNGAGQGTAATITTGLPLRSTLDGTVYDELTNEKVITRCEVVEGEVVPLATPTETPLTSTEKSALASLRTYDHTTHIDATDAPIMTVNYLLNTNNGKAVANVDNNAKIKAVTWTGTGTNTRSITFPEKPTLILSIQLTNKPSTNAGVVPFRYGAPSVFCMYGSNTSSWSGSYASALTYSVDELTMTITGADKGSAWNDETTDYILYYI